MFRLYFLPEGQRFDVVTAMEVIEHVNNIQDFAGNYSLTGAMYTLLYFTHLLVLYLHLICHLHTYCAISNNNS